MILKHYCVMLGNLAENMKEIHKQTESKLIKPRYKKCLYWPQKVQAARALQSNVLGTVKTYL